MAELAFWQQCVVSAMQGIGLGVAGLVGWLLFRHQERVKWDEEHAAQLRTLQADALLEILRALGRYHMKQVRSFQVARRRPADSAAQASAKAQAFEAFSEALDVAAAKMFLITGELGQVVQDGMADLGSASSPEDASEVVQRLERELAAWLPPLPRACTEKTTG